MVLNGEIVFRFYEFVVYCESLEIDSFYLVYFWYIFKKVVYKMDEYY